MEIFNERKNRPKVLYLNVLSYSPPLHWCFYFCTHRVLVFCNLKLHCYSCSHWKKSPAPEMIQSQLFHLDNDSCMCVCAFMSVCLKKKKKKKMNKWGNCMSEHTHTFSSAWACSESHWVIKARVMSRATTVMTLVMELIMDLMVLFECVCNADVLMKCRLVTIYIHFTYWYLEFDKAT